MFDYHGKTVVIVSVSNAQSGDLTHASYAPHLGEIHCIEYARYGARVIALDSNEEALNRIADRVKSVGGQLITVLADIQNPASLREAARSLHSSGDRINALINCHHAVDINSVESTPPEMWQQIIQFNLLGPVFSTQAFLPLLKYSDDASIIHISSIDGLFGNPQIPSYSVSKGGLIPLTHVMADEFAQYGIRVNCIARGMATPKDSPAINPMYIPLISETPLARPAFLEEITSTTLFLTSGYASYITGTVVTVDGGRTGITAGTRRNSRLSPSSRHHSRQ